MAARAYAWNAILPAVLSFSRTQPSAVTERSAIKLCYVFVTKPDLKTVLQNLKCLSLKREAQNAYFRMVLRREHLRNETS